MEVVQKRRMALNQLIDALFAMAIVGGLLLVILAKAIKTNPKVGEFLKQFDPSKLYEKIPPMPELPEKTQQLYEDRRRLI